MFKIFYFHVCSNCSTSQNKYMLIYQIEIFKITIVLQIVDFWKFSNFRIWLFYEFVKNGNFMIFEIVKLTNYQNFGIRKINKLIEFFPIWKSKIWLQKFANVGIVRSFDIPHYSQFREFSHVPFDLVNQFWSFNSFRCLFHILLTLVSSVVLHFNVC